MRDGLDELVEKWTESESTDEVSVVEYVRTLREHMDRARESMKGSERKAKAQPKKYHDRTTTTREFNEGDMVLVLLPKRKNKLLTEWLGPYQVTQKSLMSHMKLTWQTTRRERESSISMP